MLYNIKTAFILIDWTSFMNSEYWLGREVATWNDAQVIVDTNIFIKNIFKKNPMKIYEFVITKDFTF